MKLQKFYSIRGFANKEVIDFCLKEFKTLEEAEQWLEENVNDDEHGHMHFTIEKIYMT